MVAVTGTQSCNSGKNIPADTKKSDAASGKLPGGQSISPDHFRAQALIAKEPVTDSSQSKIGYFFLIENVFERGSSLVYAVETGDTIHSESKSGAPSFYFHKDDQVIILIEERLQMNSELPLFILKGIHKK